MPLVSPGEVAKAKQDLFDDIFDHLVRIAKDIALETAEKGSDPGYWNIPIEWMITLLRSEAYESEEGEEIFDAMVEDLGKQLLVNQYNLKLSRQKTKKNLVGEEYASRRSRIDGLVSDHTDNSAPINDQPILYTPGE